MASYRGIDVSNWSGYINWREVRDAGIEVAIIQASEGTFYRDPYLHEFYNGAKENGLVRSEGKEYVVQDGDVVLFRFNV